MILGIRAHDTKKLPLEERAEHIHQLGFQCAHLALYRLFDNLELENGALTPGLAMHIRRAFEESHVDIAVLGCYYNLANPNADQLRRITDLYKKHIRFASWLGCGVVGTETGAPNEAYTYVPECHSEESLLLFIENLKPIIEYAEKMGVVVAIEPVWRNIVSTPVRARKVLDAINSPNLQIILDPVNLLSEHNYAEADKIVNECIDLLGPDIAVIHIKDFQIMEGKIRSVPAGFGQMDYRPLFRYLKKKKPFIHATLEDTNPSNHELAKAYVEQLYREV